MTKTKISGYLVDAGGISTFGRVSVSGIYYILKWRVSILLTICYTEKYLLLGSWNSAYHQ